MRMEKKTRNNFQQCFSEACTINGTVLGNMSVFQAGRKGNHWKDASSIAKTGHLELLKMLKKKKSYFPMEGLLVSTCGSAFSSIEMVEWAYEWENRIASSLGINLPVEEALHAAVCAPRRDGAAAWLLARAAAAPPPPPARWRGEEEAAAGEGGFGGARWPRPRVPVETLAAACRTGNLEFVEWMYNAAFCTKNSREGSSPGQDHHLPGSFTLMLAEEAGKSGEFTVAKWVLETATRIAKSVFSDPAMHSIFADDATDRLLEFAIKEGHVNLCQKVLDTVDSPEDRFFLFERLQAHAMDALARAAERGDVRTFRRVRKVCGGGEGPLPGFEELAPGALPAAAKRGHLALVEYLLGLTSDAISEPVLSFALRSASNSGHLEVVECLVGRGVLWREEAGGLPAAAAGGGAGAAAAAAGVPPQWRRAVPGNAAAAGGHLAVLEFLHRYNLANYSTNAMNFACANGHLATVEWMHQNRIADCTGNAINLAAKEGHLAVVEWLYKHRKEGDPRKAFLRACRGGDLATCEFLFACMEESTFDTGAAAGPWGRNTVIEESPTYRRHFPKLENAEATFPQVFTAANTPFPADAEGVLTSSTQQGQSQAPAPLASVATTDATVRADRVNGPSPVQTNGPVRYTDERNEDLLPNTNAEKCLFSTDTSSFGASRKLDVRAKDSISIPAGAFDEAAGAGNLKVVEWLHQLGAQGTVSAMDDAALNNHFHMVEWLHYNRAEGCTKLAFDSCARTGNLEMMQWLHYHRNEGGTSDAFDMAAGNGRLTMVEFLHNCTASEATTDAMDRAARKGHLLTLAWLHRRRGEGASARVWAGVLDDDEDADEGGPEGWGGGSTRKDYYDCGRPNRFSGNSFRRLGVPATRRRNFSGDAERKDGVGGEEGSVLLWDSPSTLAEQQVEVIQSWLQINKPPKKG